MTFAHPIPKCTILRCTSERESVTRLVEVRRRLLDIDDGTYSYKLACPNYTNYYRYRDEDVDELFKDTGLVNDDSRKPIADDEIRALYQELHHHVWHDVHAEDGEKVGEVCVVCQLERGEVEV